MGQFLHLIIVLLLVGGASMVKVIVEKLQQQAALRRAQMDAERRRLESLRTGREAPAPSEPARTPLSATQDPRTAQQGLEDLARRRAAQLQELRRMQQERYRSGAQPAPSQGGQVLTRIPGSSGPTVPGTRPAPIPPRAPARRPQQQQRQRPKNQPQARPTGPTARPMSTEGRAPDRREPDRRQPASPVRQVQEQQARAEVLEPLAARIAAAPQAVAAPPPGARLPATLLRLSDWRRALIMSEVLGPPLAARTGDTGPLARRT